MTLKHHGLIAGCMSGTAYGLAAYFGFGKFQCLPTLAFLALVPMAMGVVPLLLSDDDQVTNYVSLLLTPWLSVVTLFVLLLAVGAEGLFCVALLASPFLAAALLGASLAWLIRAVRISKRKRQAAATIVLLIPLLFVAIENRYLGREESFTVRSSTVVAAPVASVWTGLAVVDTIGDGDYQPGLLNRLGVPRPIRATLDRAGVGGQRVGEFEHGLRFNEVITAYDVPSRMSFSIGVDPTTLRRGSAERHAFEQGYFRFVDATYVLEPVGATRARLSLSSRYVLKSSVNFYGNVWARAVVGDFQDRVLQVLKRRAERSRSADEFAERPSR